MNKKIYILVAIACAGCSAESRNLAELRRLCEEDAGFMVYRAAQADGYYDASIERGALRLLVPSNFIFIEYCDLEPNITSLFDEPGCWRLTKVPREVGQCNEVVDEVLASSGGGGYPEFRVESCIEVRKLESPEAQYSFHSEVEAWFSDNDISRFTRSYAYFKDREFDEILSEYISYSYNDNPAFSSSTSCYSIDDKFPPFIETNFFESTINSNTEVR